MGILWEDPGVRRRKYEKFIQGKIIKVQDGRVIDGVLARFVRHQAKSKEHCNKCSDLIISPDSSRGLQRLKRLNRVAELEIMRVAVGGRVGLPHLWFLARASGTTLHIRGRGLVFLIGSSGPLVHGVYRVGHWTLPGGHDACEASGHNNCLFDVVASQTRQDSHSLRLKTVQEMTRGIPRLIKMAAVIKYYNSPQIDKCLMLGGATYNGWSAASAKVLLDESQDVAGLGTRLGLVPSHSAVAHPRGHAYDPNATGELDNVQNYSKKGSKTAFQSRADQDRATHLALSSPAAQELMGQLNAGSTREVLTFTGDLGHLLMDEWAHGAPISRDIPIAGLKLVLQHHQGRMKDPHHNVHILTCFPLHY